MRNFALNIVLLCLFLVAGAHVPQTVADKAFDCFLGLFAFGALLLVLCGIAEAFLGCRARITAG